MKKIQKYRFTGLAFFLGLALCACGLNGGDLSSSEEPERGEEAEEISRLSGIGAKESSAALPDSVDNATADTDEAAQLLDVAFFGSRDEAEAAAEGYIAGIHESDAAGDGSYNPMSWCYALITAIHDDTVLQINRGYDGITVGDEHSGFVATDSECYEFLDAGDQFIAQLNVEWYPVYQIIVSDEEYKTTLLLGGDIYTSKDENGIPAALKVTGLKIIEPIALYRESHYIADPESVSHIPDYSYGSVLELIYADDEQPELKERLNEMNTELEDEYREGLDMLGLEAAEAYASSVHFETEEYYKSVRTSTCRADETVLSFVRYYDTGLGSVNHSTAVGFNLDSSTGLDVSLDAVLKDIDALPEVVYERCEDYGFAEADCEAYRRVVSDYIDAGEYISSEELSWNICYEGLWLHFNNTVAERDSVFLPFTYFPDLVSDKYSNVPVAYCYDIETRPDFKEYYELELYKDGSYVDFALWDDSLGDPAGFADEFTLEIDGKTGVLTEGIFGSAYDVFVVHSEANLDYLYIQQYGAQENNKCAIYDLSYANAAAQGLYLARVADGSVCDLYVFGEWDDHSNGINCRFMTDPTHFLLTRRDTRFGVDFVYARQELARDGGPMKTDAYWIYAFSGSWKLYPLYDMELPAVNEDGESTGGAVLNKDTLIRPYRTDSYSWVDMIDQEGNIYRIETEGSWQSEEGNLDTFTSADGKSAEELFGGIVR